MSSDKFELYIQYRNDSVGTEMQYLMEGKIKGKQLLRVMNLDRLDSRNNSTPDGRFDYVEGTKSSPVGYLEGIFVEENFRNKGYAKELLNACENWAKDKGCKEFASDCELDNLTSLKFHLSMGFDEANRIICFKKEL